MNKIEQNVMASVGLIYAFRTLTGLRALKLYVLILSLWGIMRLVWVSKVAENFLVAEKAGIAGISNYILVALSHAHLGVQIVLVIGVLAAGSLFLDVARAAPTRRLYA